MIPRIIHIIWVGDESARPDALIDTWRARHPGWAIRVWGNAEYAGAWRLKAAMEALWPVELNGVADIMRWEILHRHGGFATDADSECIAGMPANLFAQPFACWESEIERPGLIATGAMAFEPGDPLIARIIGRIARRPIDSLLARSAWQTVGPRILTEEVSASMHPLKILPSHYFFPRHYTGRTYDGPGPVYARQFWNSTNVVPRRP